jgi:hypothetical protein
MNIKRKSPRTVLAYQTFIRRANEFITQLAEEEGYEEGILDVEAINYLVLSARVEFDKGEVDFELLTLKDETEEAQVKFLQYLETEHYQIVEQAVDEINKLDAPVDRALAPEPPAQKK